MEKVKISHGEHLRLVTLYRDDLENLVKIFHELTGAIDIQTAGYRLANLEELPQLRTDTIDSLALRCHDPYVSLTIEPGRIWLYIDDNSPVQRGLFEKIKAYINSKYPLGRWVLDNSIMPGNLGGASLALLVMGAMRGSNLFLTIGIAGVILSFFWIWWAIFGVRKRRIMILTRRSEASNFLVRKKDDLILAIVSALLGALVTFVVTKLF